MEYEIIELVAENPEAVGDLLWTSAKSAGHIVVELPDMNVDTGPDVNFFVTSRGTPSGNVSATASHVSSFNASATASTIN